MASFFEQLMNPASQGILNTAAGLLQASGPSLRPVSFGQALGQGFQQGSQAYQGAQHAQLEQQMADVRKRFMEAQIGAMNRPTVPESQIGKVNPQHYTADSLAKFSMTKNFADLVPVPGAEASPLAKISPKDYTAESFKKYTETGNAADLVAVPRQPLVNVQNLPADKRFEWEDKLRSDYKTDVKAFREVEDAHRIIKNALQNPSPANDMAAATKFMKLLDPGSVVRESELNMAMQASGVLDRMSNYHNLLLQGHKLTPSQRLDFAQAADIIYKNVQAKWGEMDAIYDESAKSYGLDPKRVKMGGGSKASLPVRKVYNPTTGKFE
jgi:hypothetical protein